VKPVVWFGDSRLRIQQFPEDARRVFFFTEPRVPAGWHGALLPLRGTTIWIHH